MKKIDYIVISVETGRHEDISTKVNMMIQKGWKPLGGVSASSIPGIKNMMYECLHQAMIREIEE